jgi:transcriptional regulator with XRE-family HTH domain
MSSLGVTIDASNEKYNRHVERIVTQHLRVDYDGAKIVTLRRKKGWSQAELARRSGIKQSSLWLIEEQVTKKPKATTLFGIASALGVPVREILRPTKKGAALIAAARALLESQK